jgi:hypothetical protein
MNTIPSIARPSRPRRLRLPASHARAIAGLSGPIESC